MRSGVCGGFVVPAIPTINEAKQLYDVYSPERFGAKGDGTTDDTAAIQAAINACPSGGVLWLSSSVYKITAALSITKNLTIRGAGVCEVFGAVAATDAAGSPTAAPWLTGAVLLQATAATNAINITGTGITVHLEGFGIRFADAIAFNNTGHGVYAVSTAMSGAGHENCVIAGRWTNIAVFGHDGNHYAFYSINLNYVTVSHLRGYGGGGWYQECDSIPSAYGNSLIENPYFCLCAGGTAHAFHLKSRTAGFPGDLNLLVFIRPQSNVKNVTSSPLGSAFSIPVPTASQYLWREEGNPQNVLVIAPDLERPGSILSPITFGSQTVVQPAGGIFAGFNPPPAFRQRKPYGGVPSLTIQGGTGAGGSAVLAGGSNDERGGINITTGGFPFGADSAAVVQVFLAAWVNIGAVLIQPLFPVVSMDAKFYPKNFTANSFEVWSHAGLAATTSYAFQYLVID